MEQWDCRKTVEQREGGCFKEIIKQQGYCRKTVEQEGVL